MYTVGSVVHLTAAFNDANGPVDPPSVTVTITLPDGTPAPGSPFTAVKDSVGVYHYDYTTTVPNQHQYYFTGTGETIQNPDVFTVAPLTTTALISLADAKEALNIKAGNTSNDGEILLAVRAATQIINDRAGYTVAQSFTETVPPSVDGKGHRMLMLSRTPVLSVQSITPRMQGMPAVDITTLNINTEAGVIYLANWFQWYGPQQVTYTAGRATVPEALQEACRIQLQDIWETQRGNTNKTPSVGGSQMDTADTSAYGTEYRVMQLIKLAGYFPAPGLA